MEDKKQEQEQEREKYGMIPLTVFKAKAKGRITANECCIYAAIATYTSKYNCAAWPSQSSIAELVGSTQATVSRAITKMISIGLLSTKKERKPARRATYVLLKHPVGQISNEDALDAISRADKARVAMATAKEKAATAKANTEEETSGFIYDLLHPIV